MISQAASFASPFHSWHWPIDCASYDCSPAFTEAECQEIAFLAVRTGNRAGGWPKRSAEVLRRLLQPLEEVCRVGAEIYAVSTERTRRASTICAFVREMSRQRAPYWAWDTSVWIEFITPALECFNTRLGWSWTRESKPQSGTRLRALLAAYLFEALPDVRVCGGDVPFVKLASLVFGWGHIEATLERIMAHLLALGYSSHKRPGMMRALCTVLLLNRSPYLEDVTSEGIRWVYETSSFSNQSEVATLSRALTSLGMLKEGIVNPVNGSALTLSSADGTLSPKWEDWCQQWRALSTLEPPVTRHSYTTLLMIGRWLQREHPDITSPTQWTAQLASECVAAITHWKIGEYAGDYPRLSKGKTSSLGKPVKPRTIHSYLSTLRRFFKDLQESEKIPCLFNPDRYLALPRSVRHKIGPDPRVIDRPLWAKLVWAGQHLSQEDLPSAIYPLEMIRAVAAVWLFTALRSDEICRLRLGCIEWPATDIVEPETGKRVSREQVCYLHIPANKTSPAFKKPVAPYVGKMIAAWEQVQPHQEPVLDRKSAEKVAYLFSMRGRRLGANYLNAVLIPLLATKANVPPLDHRGRVTSHRARATIATFLGNCENPMSLWQLMRWLGHRTEATTRNYVSADLTKVAVKIAEGSFFQQNLASIPVVIDTEAVISGRAAQGEPWKFFDLGVAAFGSEIVFDTFGESSRNPLWRQIIPIMLRPFTRSECDRMVQDIGAMNAMYYTSEALGLLYECTNGHPQVTRELCAKLAEQLKDRPHVVQLYEMGKAIEQFAADYLSSVGAIYQSLSHQEQAILIHLVREKQITSTELYQALKEEFKSLQDFNKTLMRMIQFGFLQKEEVNSALHLSFGLFKRYLVILP